MNKKYLKYLYYLPRVLTIFFIIFISIFALDVFSEDYTFLQTVIALFMHLIPSFLLIIALSIAWKYELIGGIIFILLGLSYLIMFWNKIPFSAYLIIPLSLFLIGILFLLNKYYIK